MRTLASRIQHASYAQPWLTAVFVIGLGIRAILLPMHPGQDFIVWDKASAATLHGINIYAHHPNYPAGPYAYFPLFIYLELPFQWLSQHSDISFTVLGKIPILLGDVLTAWVLAAELKDRGHRPPIVAAGAALFYLNPLVLDNSALYGRFDTLSCGLLLVALREIRKSGKVSARGAVYFALSVAAKTFPVFVALGLINAGRNARRLVLISLTGVIGLLSLPYLGSIPAYLHDALLYDAGKMPQALSWERAFLHMTDPLSVRVISFALLGAFVAGAIWLRRRVPDLGTYTLLTLLLFLLCSKVVLAHYLIWPMPWLILATFRATAAPPRSSAMLLVLFTGLGMQMNPHFRPFGQYPEGSAYILAGATAAYIVASISITKLGARARYPAQFEPQP